ncbi:MAG: flagellar export chaperone FliS [Vicinamibacterales bacterium]
MSIASMTPPTRAAQQYLRTQVQASSPIELVVLLYDQALRSGQAAREALARRDIPARRDAISRVMGIVTELQSTLDMERGGTVAQELDRLYDWITARLLDVTMSQDARPLEEVLSVLETLRDAWSTIARQPAGTHP